MMLCERCQHLADFRVEVLRHVDGVSLVDDIESCAACLAYVHVDAKGMLTFTEPLVAVAPEMR